MITLSPMARLCPLHTSFFVMVFVWAMASMQKMVGRCMVFSAWMEALRATAYRMPETGAPQVDAMNSK
jgi:hypothetical protein